MDVSVLPQDAFLEEIQELLESTPRVQLRRNVMAYASELSLERRLEFFQLLSFSEEEVAEDDDLNSAAEDLCLVPDVEHFLENVRNRVYDHSLDIEQVDQAPQWVDHMDVLFSRTNEAYFHERKQQAREAYAFLFKALHIAEDIALDHGSYSAQDFLVTDLYECKSRYLRCVYDTEKIANRSKALLQVLRDNLSISQASCGLAEIQEADYEELQELDEFIPLWREALSKKTRREDFEVTRQWLLREVTFLTDGTEGLLKLSQEEGSDHPEIFYDLVNIHVKSDDLKKAEEVCKLGISTLKNSHHQAVLADWLSEIASNDGDTSLALNYRQTAWRLEPSQQRLVNWCATNHGVLPDEQLIEEVTFLREQRDNRHVRLVCMLDLLAGEYELPRRALLAADPIGWTLETHPGPIVLPYLLLVASGIDKIPLRSSLHDLSEEMKSVFVRWQDHYADGDQSERPHTFLDYVLLSLHKHSPSRELRESMLDTVRVVVLDRVKAIADKGMKHAYRKVAHLATAYVEACLLFGEEELADSMLQTLRNRHFRNTALRGEMRQLLESSEVTRDNAVLSR